jgi:hypothetical protein
MMKKLSAIFILFLLCAGYLCAQSSTQSADPALEEIRAARKTMDVIELHLVRSSDDKHAAALILEDKEANEGAYLYLIEIPGYEQAVTNKTLLEFKKNVKSKDKVYRKLAKAAHKTQIEKQKYIASFNPNYQEALQLYTEATK